MVDLPLVWNDPREPVNHNARVNLSFQHRLRFADSVFSAGDPHLADLMRDGEMNEPRALVFLDDGVRDAHPLLNKEIDRWANANGVELAGTCVTVPGGETCKNDPSVLEDALRAIHDARLCRRSYAIAVGGGAVLDLVGHAATIAHRGVRLIRVPSTTLSQCDSGVGVKNGVNAFGKKNYLGTFSVPWAVINDESLLPTLTDDQWRDGFSEIVKVSLLKDAPLFESLERETERITTRDMGVSLPMIRRSAELHLEHICGGGDPFEMTEARPLDFGHWAAHKLEQMTDFEVSHGHAVAIGLAVDVLYANAIGVLDDVTSERVLASLESLGFALSHPSIEDSKTLLEGLEEFREHLGGRLTITLIDAVGSQRDVHEIDERAMAECLRTLARRAASQPVR